MPNTTLNGAGGDYSPFEITRSLKILLASTTIPIFIIGAFGNISVLVAVMKAKNLRTVSNILTVSLIGLSFLIICYGYPLQQLMDVFLIRTQPWCYLFGSSMLSISVQFTMVMLFVTVERYVTICMPFTAHAIFTPRNVLATVLIILVYGLCAGMGAGGIIWMGKDDLWLTERRCNVISMIPSRGYILVLMVHWMLPLPVMIILYLRIFAIVRRHLREIAVLVPCAMPAPSWKELQKQGEKRASLLNRNGTPTVNIQTPEDQPSSVDPNKNEAPAMADQTLEGQSSTVAKQAPMKQSPPIANSGNYLATAMKPLRRLPSAVAINIPRGPASTAIDRNNTPSQGPNPIQMKAHRRLIKEAKSALVLFVIVLTYFFCWVPFSIFAVAGILSGESVSPEGFVIAHCVVYSSGFITPYVYGFGNKSFRVILIDMFCRRRGDPPAEDNQSIPTIVTDQRG